MIGNNKRMKDGFSLIEIIIAIAIVGIVMSGVILLISYSTNMMRKTNNSVSLQNESKDGMLHITTHVQEGSDVDWKAADHELTIARKVKGPDGSVTELEVNHYWLDTDSVAAGGGGAISAVSSGAADVRGVIYYTKNYYPQYDGDGNLTSGAITEYVDANSGEVKWDKLAISDHGALQTAENAFIKNVIGFNCKVNERIDAVATNPVSPGGAISISGKSVTIQLALKNETGDAKFNNVKEIYLRNQ